MISNNNITNPKCSKCKCYFIPTTKSSGEMFKTCEKCRTKDKEARKCEHDKEGMNANNSMEVEYVSIIK